MFLLGAKAKIGMFETQLYREGVASQSELGVSKMKTDELSIKIR